MNNVKDYIPKPDLEIKISNNIIKCKKSILIKYFIYFKDLYNTCDLTDCIDNIDNKYCLLSHSNNPCILLFPGSGNKMVQKLLKTICIKDEIKEHQIFKLLNIESNYVLQNKNMDKIIAQKINLLIDILDYFVATDLLKEFFYNALCLYIEKINKIKGYIDFNENIITSFIIFTIKKLDEVYTLSDDYSVYEGSYIGLTRHYVGPGRYISDNNIKEDIYSLLSIIIFWKKDILKYLFYRETFVDEIEIMIKSLQETGYLFNKKYEKIYFENKDIIPFNCIKFKDK